MRRDPQLSAILNAYFLPLLRARWALDGTGCKPEVVQHVSDDLGVAIKDGDDTPGPARRRGVIWQRHLREALNYLPFGHMPFERRYMFDAQGAAHLDNLGVRTPWTIAQIKVNTDGSIDQVEQTTQRDPLPANRLVWYANNKLGANWAGESVLRPAFGAWLLKHEAWRVHATSIRRFGMGVPTVEAPPGATQQQLLQAQQMASAMRAGDQAGMAVPQGFKAYIAGMTGSVPDALGFIRYLDQAMAKMAMTGLIELGQTETGSRALGDAFLDLFLLSLQSVAEEITLTATSGHPGMPGIITDIVDQNWGEDEPAPRLVCLDLGESYEVTADAVQALVMCGAVTPDEELDNAMRQRWGLPKRKGPWVPSSRGLPAGMSTKPGAEQAQLQSDEAAGEPKPGPLTASARVKPAYIAASRWEPERHQAEYEEALAHLLLQYRSVWAAQRTDLVDQVLTALQNGDAPAVAQPAGGDGASIVQQSMETLAVRAARAMIDEAAQQGVRIDIDQVRIDAERLGGVAAARTHVMGSWAAQQATAKALQVYGPSPEGFVAAADEVDRYLAGLQGAQLRDHLGAALTAAQNAGRYAVLEAAPPNQHVTYVAAEWLDSNTCENCRKEDGHEYLTLPEAEAAYPTGGYKDCQGLMRCRGTVVAVWGDESTTLPKAASAPVAKFDPLEHRDAGGKWSVSGGVAHFKGHKGIGRQDMPQLSGMVDGQYRSADEMVPQFIKHLRAQGVNVTTKRVPPQSLKPTQATGDMKVIGGIADALRNGSMADTKPIVVSSDGHVIDGHHTWAARLLADHEGARLPAGLPVHQTDLPIDQLLSAAHTFAGMHGIKSRRTGQNANPAHAKFDPLEKRDDHGKWSRGGEVKKALADTFDQHTNGQGEFTPQRKQLHQKVIGGILAGHQPQEHPVATFFGGGSGSGKSSLTGAGAKIDADAIKEHIPEYKQMTKAGDKRAAAHAHEESSYIAGSAVAEARKNRLHYTLDGTGDSEYAKMQAKVEAAKKAGYLAHGKYVTVDTNVAVERAAKRAERTGRMVPEPVIRDIHGSVSRVFEQAVKNNLFDYVELWDNNGAHPRLIGQTMPGGKFQVLDDAAYKAFLAKGHAK
jgi:predicted ABC-type ATPase